MPFPRTLATARLRLTAAGPADSAILADLLRGAYTSRGLDALTGERAAGVARYLTAHWEHYAYGPYVIALEGGARIGNCGFKHRRAHGDVWPPDADDLELGFALLPPYRGRGYMTEAVRAALATAWASGISAVHARCDVANASSAAVLVRGGFSECPSAISAERAFIADAP